jgi:hypothetical protein
VLDAFANFIGGKKHKRVSFKAGKRIRKIGERHRRCLLDFVGDP